MTQTWLHLLHHTQLKGDQPVGGGGGGGSSTTTTRMTRTWLHQADSTYSRARPKNQWYLRKNYISREAQNKHNFRTERNPEIIIGCSFWVTFRSWADVWCIPSEGVTGCDNRMVIIVTTRRDYVNISFVSCKERFVCKTLKLLPGQVGDNRCISKPSGLQNLQDRSLECAICSL